MRSKKPVNVKIMAPLRITISSGPLTDLLLCLMAKVVNFIWENFVVNLFAVSSFVGSESFEFKF